MKFNNINLINVSLNRQDIAFYSCFLIIIGLVFSRFMMTFGMIVLIANSVINKQVFKSLKSFTKDYVMLSITSLFFLYLLSGIYSEDQEYFIERIRIKLPFLILPFAFSAIKLSKKQILVLLYSFVFVITLSSLGSFLYYIYNYNEITQSYIYAKVLPTPINHIRYSLMIAFSIIIGIYIVIENIRLGFKAERYFMLGCIIFQFVFLHFLSVRSGLLAFYIVLICLIFKYIIINKRILPGILLLSSLLIIPVIAYYSIHSFQNKLSYVKYDIERYFKEKNTENFSDAKRIVSIKIGLHIARENMLIGTGIGDLKKEAEKIYNEYYPNRSTANRIMPHNQFVFVLSGLGIIGLLWFMFAFFYPIIVSNHYKDSLFFSFNMIILISFFVEATIETQIGTAFYLLFLLLMIQYLKSKPIHNA